MQLGTFSVSLAVKDLEASRAFYQKFGFTPFAGDPAQKWLILKNGDHVIGLFQGMFEKNILTFNPGWDSNAQKLASFTDIRELQRQLKAQGVELQQEADESTSGPASLIAVDPDGNQILLDRTSRGGQRPARDGGQTAQFYLQLSATIFTDSTRTIGGRTAFGLAFAPSFAAAGGLGSCTWPMTSTL